MNKFPPLHQWFDTVTDKPNTLGYVRHDFKIKSGLSPKDLDNLTNELCLLIARLRLNRINPLLYDQWCDIQNGSKVITDEQKLIFRDVFRDSFISNKTEKDFSQITWDLIALQGYIGEIFLYIIQTQLYKERILASPVIPKQFSKDSGIDCLEIGGDINDADSLHYIIWECKATTNPSPGNYPAKILSQHLYETQKGLNKALNQLAESCKNDPILSNFISELYEDYYKAPPTTKKRLGGCVTLSRSSFAPENSFCDFKTAFDQKLAEDNICRQVRLCSVGDLNNLVQKVRDVIWNKLLP